jgi:hypothetical protein
MIPPNDAYRVSSMETMSAAIRKGDAGLAGLVQL